MTKIFIATILIIGFFVASFFFLNKTEDAEINNTASLTEGENKQESEVTENSENSMNSTEEVSYEAPTQEDIDAVLQKETIAVAISTTKGDIKLELYPKVAPKTVANFVKLANAGFYNGTKFHRVISDFMIQGGDRLSITDEARAGTGGPGYQFEDEINPSSLGLSDEQISALSARGFVYNDILESMKVEVGTIAMANSGPNTNGSQFFIVTERPQPHLDGMHTVFGRVTNDMDMVRSIAQGDVMTKVEVTEMIP